MATVEQAREVEIDRALVEIRQRLQQMDAHPVKIQSIIQEAHAQNRLVIATLWLAGAAWAAAFVTVGIAIAPLFHR